ncbi:molybdopterin-dependent oxidoreductase [Chloroflexota bacterium]
MKKILITLIVMMVLAGCGASAMQETTLLPEPVLTIVNGDNETIYTVQDLQALPSNVSSFNEIDYMGVSIKVLLEEVGVILDDISAVKAVATDGYSVNYEPTQLLPDDVLVAYSLADGNSMAEDEGIFRMVLPDQEGNQNLRMLSRIVIIP